MIEYSIIIVAYILVLFALGLGFTLFFRKVLRISDIFSFTVHSLIFGLISSSTLLLILGQFGFQIFGQFFYYLFLLLGGVSIFIFIYLFHTNKNSGEIKEIFDLKISFKERETILVSLSFLLIGFILFFINSKTFFTQIDELRYWLMDTKIIYFTERLRSNPDYINAPQYSSFIPLQFAQIYKLFGRVVEQYTSIISILYLLLGLSLMYVNIRSFQRISKLFGLLVIFIVGMIFYPEAFLSYADIPLAFYVLFTAVVVSKQVPLKEYPKKIFLIIVGLTLISYVKLPNFLYSPYSIIIFILWLLLDRKVIFSFVKNYRNWKLTEIILMLSPFLIYISRYYYMNYIYTIPKITVENNTTISRINLILKEGFLGKLLTYPQFVGEYLWEWHRGLMLFTIIVFLFVLTTIYISLRNKNKKNVISNRKRLFFFSVVAVIFPLLNLGFYALNYRRSQLDRYLTVPIFVSGILLTIIFNQKYFKRVRKYLFLVIFILLFTLPSNLSSVKFQVPFDANTGGEYRNSQNFEEAADISDQVKDITDNKKIMIGRFQLHCGDLDQFCITNGSNKVKKYRYFLYDSTLGGKHKVMAEDLSDFLRDNDLEYILITVGFEFVKYYDTDGEMDKYVHLYKFNDENDSFEYIKGFIDYEH